MLESRRLLELAERVVDGHTPDWDAEESTASDEERRFIRQLRLASQAAQERAHLHLSSLSARVLMDEPPLAPDASWGTLKILAHAGRGHFGHVYRAWDPALHRTVALKILHARMAAASDREDDRVIDEGRLMARVRHPNVVTIHGAQRIDGRIGLWMEFVDGETVETRLQTQGVMTADAVAQIGLELCGALAAVHAAGLVHRDVKAQNVLRDSTGRVVLGDFGTGREYTPADIAPPDLAGTPAYAAPEILRGEAATPRSDIYSLGVLLFHLATGSYPVAGTSLRAIREAHDNGRRTTVRSARQDFPADLAALIDRAADPDPDRRFASASDVSVALRRWQTRAVRRRRLPLIAAGTLVALVSLGWLLWNSTRAIELRPADWVMIADVENATSDPLLDSTVALALTADLSASSLINVVSRDRVEDVLRLMRKPLDTRLDLTTARELALRDGNIHAIVLARIAPNGSAYDITLQIAQPSGSPSPTTLHQRAAGPADLLPAVGRLSAQLRQRLGESQRPGALTPAPRVTTSSFEALQLYARAAEIVRAQDPARLAEAETLLRKALQKDPEFAMAHMLLHHTFALQPSLPPDVALKPPYWPRPQLEKALEFSRNASDIERLYIEGFYHDIKSLRAPQLERTQLLEVAVDRYEALLRLTPDYWNTHERLRYVYQRLNRLDDAQRLTKQMVARRPHSFVWVGIAGIYAMRAGDMATASHYAERAKQLTQPEIVPGNSDALIVWVRLFDAKQAWLQDDGKRAVADVDRLAAEIPTIGDFSPRVALHVAYAYMALGRLKAAEAALSWTSGNFWLRLELLIEQDRPGEARALITKQLATSTGLGLPNYSLLLRAGDVATARKIFAAERAKLSPERLASVEAELALAEPRYSDATERWRAQVEAAKQLAPAARRRAAVGLATALSAGGDFETAIRVLEAAPRPGPIEIVDTFAPAISWPGIRVTLAELYRRVGRHDDANTVEREVLQLLGAADDDHPLLRRLRSPAR